MWFQVQKILGGAEREDDRSPPVIPLRKFGLGLDDIAVGKTIRFSKACPLKPLSGASATVIATRYYRFGDDAVKTHVLKLGNSTQFSLTVAKDEEGQYLALSRLLNVDEQDTWFGHDALSFFTEASSAKSIRCKADPAIEGAWAAGRYSKNVDWVEGSISQTEGAHLRHSIHYSLLVNEAGDQALEIEHEDASGENRFYVTVYRPITDVSAVEIIRDAEIAANDDEPQLFKEPAIDSTPGNKVKPGFRQLEEALSEEIHIERTPPTLEIEEPAQAAELPSFLVPPQDHYLSMDQVIPPESEKVRVSMAAAGNLIFIAQQKNVRVRDVLRDIIGLPSALSEEVIFEMPLSDDDYRTLAMRYKLRPDHRVEIRSRLEEELRHKLVVAKP